MKIRKDMIFAVLTTFCLSALMFAVIPIRSGLPAYDPWADITGPNGVPDDKIDIRDVSLPAKLFGALNTDNLTRNVNVTNWPITIQTMPATDNGRIVWVNPLPGVSDGYHNLAAIDTKGYKKLYFLLVCEAGYPNNYCNLTVGWRMQGTFNESASWYSQVDHFEAFENATRDSAYLEFDIKGITLIVWLGDTFANLYEMSYYLTA